MKLFLTMLEITCKNSTERLCLTDVSYFYGKIGSGKSTIAHLIDYCFGGDLVDTPAIQDEFIAATLYLRVGDTKVELSRERGSASVQGVWDCQDGQHQILLPTGSASAPVIPDTTVANLSDFLFFVGGVTPPRVRRSREREDSDLKRLSFRNMYWYCYLDQDEIDSSFFHLGRSADQYKRLDSRNVLRFIVGVHQEEVAELEMKLDEVRRGRQRLQEAAKVLEQTITESGFSTEIEIQARRQQLDQEREKTQQRLSAFREGQRKVEEHAVDELRHRGQDLAAHLEAIERAIQEIDHALKADQRHLNEILNLSTKVQRVAAARAILRGVEFERCPRCAQSLPGHEAEVCRVCAQLEPSPGESQDQVNQTRVDLVDRKKELEEIIDAQKAHGTRLHLKLKALQEEKKEVDRRLNEAMQEYDSAYLSTILEDERMLAEIQQEFRYLEKLSVLPEKVAALKDKSAEAAGEEVRYRELLKDARQRAEADLNNLDRLRNLFLDCLLRARIPGFSSGNEVKIDPPNFVPEVIGRSGELATSTFDNLSSGGMKTLFKCCFALSVHRLVAEVGGILPTLLIIDSPMKNISERENRSQFEGFYELVYDLALGELEGTQFILIDKELCPPSQGFGRNFLSRHMTTDEEAAPPLISYYRGTHEMGARGGSQSEEEAPEPLGEEQLGDEPDRSEEE